MSLNKKNIGIAFTGSFCCLNQTISQIQKLIDIGINVKPIFSFNASKMKYKFYNNKKFIRQIKKITQMKPILTIEDAEPIGPKNILDILVIIPCTGNTIAKLANGITDTPVLMAAKAQLRNHKPVLISISTNDALGNNMKNIGTLLNSKNIYFVPFGQDNPDKKPNSITSHINKLIPSIKFALNGKQIQPILL